MMSANKATIEKYIEGFRQGDHASILGCLAEDVVWDMPACTYEGQKAIRCMADSGTCSIWRPGRSSG